MKYRIALMLALLLIAFAVPPADAQGCTFPLADMAGAYESDTMRLVVYPCGAVSLAWVNAYGTHSAGYMGFGRLAYGAGIMARGVIPDAMSGLYLDGSPHLGIKAAEAGYIQLATYGPSVDPLNMPVHAVYRLRKMP